MRLYHPSAFDFSTPVDSHWEASAPPLDIDMPPLEGTATTDVAIIGAGFAGLNAALRLATAHGIQPLVLDAARPGWGASGRNGGFCCAGSSKLTYGEMISRYGLEETKQFFRTQVDSVDHVGALLAEHGIDAQRSGQGDWLLAHRPGRAAELAAERDFMAKTFGLDMLLMGKEELAERGLASPAFHGGLVEPGRLRPASLALCAWPRARGRGPGHHHPCRHAGHRLAPGGRAARADHAWRAR